jgi:hypothetical protein
MSLTSERSYVYRDYLLESGSTPAGVAYPHFINIIYKHCIPPGYSSRVQGLRACYRR